MLSWLPYFVPLISVFVQVVLINAVRDVAKALAELIGATKCAAGKPADDPSMYQLKSAAKVMWGVHACVCSLWQSLVVLDMSSAFSSGCVSQCVAIVQTLCYSDGYHTVHLCVCMFVTDQPHSRGPIYAVCDHSTSLRSVFTADGLSIRICNFIHQVEYIEETSLGVGYHILRLYSSEDTLSFLALKWVGRMAFLSPLLIRATLINRVHLLVHLFIHCPLNRKTCALAHSCKYEVMWQHGNE